MANYVKITDYSAKDALLTGNPAKLVKGSEIGADFDAVAVAVATKADSNSPVLTTPQINDASSTHQYVFVASELVDDRNVTLPLLTGNDEFVFKDHAQTLTNKTISGASNTLSNIGNSSLTNSSVTINGNTVSLGGSTTVTATASNALTIGTGLSGTSYNGSSPVTVAIDSTVATLTGTQELTNKTLNASVLKGTFTASGTVTLPALTLGGAVTGNSQNISGLGTLGCGAITSTGASSFGTVQVGGQAQRTGTVSGVATRTIITGATSESPILAIDGYGNNVQGAIELSSSGSSTLGALTATGDTRYVGVIGFTGVNSSSARTQMGYITMQQSGAAGATYNSGLMQFCVGTSSAAPTNVFQLGATAITTGSGITSLAFSAGNPSLTIGTGALTAGSGTITLGNTSSAWSVSNSACSAVLASGSISLIVNRTTGPGAALFQYDGTQSGQVQAKSGGGLLFYQGATPTLAATLDSTGLAVTGTLSATTTGKVGTTLGVGNATPAASGAGITFPAAQSASSDANTLDDYREATFTATATGMTTSPTGTATFVRTGNQITLDIPTISGTSNAVTFTLTGMPTTCRPSATRTAPVRVQDNTGSITWGMAQIDSAGVITLYKDAASGAFTASGTKSINTCSVAYVI